jgi:hypothetical protein
MTGFAIGSLTSNPAKKGWESDQILASDLCFHQITNATGRVATADEI